MFTKLELKSWQKFNKIPDTINPRGPFRASSHCNTSAKAIWIKANNATTQFFWSCIGACILVRTTLTGRHMFCGSIARVQVFKYSNSVYWGVDACSGCPTSTLPSPVLFNGGLFTAHCSRLSGHALSDSFSPCHCTTIFSWALRLSIF